MSEGKLEVLIKWKDLPSSESTWEHNDTVAEIPLISPWGQGGTSWKVLLGRPIVKVYSYEYGHGQMVESPLLGQNQCATMIREEHLAD